MGTKQREGRIERALREHLAANPNEAFTTDNLCAICYPEQASRRSHRVVVLRAIDKALPGFLPDWRARRTVYARGNMLVFYNAASVPSTAKADVLHDGWRNRWARKPAWDDDPKRLAKAERAVAEYTIMRDGTDEQRRQLTDRRAAEQELWAAEMSFASTVAKNPVGVLLSASRVASGNLSELAGKARALIVENDPDAIRDGLREIAAALDQVAQETHDPMATIAARLE